MYDVVLSDNMQRQLKYLLQKQEENKLSKNNEKLLNKVNDCFDKLKMEPHPNGLKDSPYPPLNNLATQMNGKPTKAYHSYLENNTSSARRVYWYYGDSISKEYKTIVVMRIAKHPKMNSANAKVNLKEILKEDDQTLSLREALSLSWGGGL